MKIWEPIETAPKDGTIVLLRGKKGKIADGCYAHGRFVWPYILANPTQWMPLPSPAFYAEIQADALRVVKARWAQDLTDDDTYARVEILDALDHEIDRLLREGGL